MNIILIGMPGCGKSSAGVLLAKDLCKMFVDTDLLIQEAEKLPLQQIIDKKGLSYFKKAEEKAILSLTIHNAVVATGGSVVYSEAAMAHLKKQGIVIFLDSPLNTLIKRIKNLKTRGVVLPEGYSFKDIYKERYPLYKKYADYIVPCSAKPISSTVNDIAVLLEEKGDLFENL